MRYCNKCGFKLKKEAKFCSNCGNEFIKKESKIEKAEKDIKEVKDKVEKEIKKISDNIEIPHWLLPWIVLGILIVLSGVILLPTKVISYQLEIPYIDTEIYTVEVPYEDIEEYSVQVPYETKEQYVESIPVKEEEQIKYSGEWIKCSSTGFFSTGESTVKITNTDTEGGTFTIKIGYIDNAGNFISDTKSRYISPSIPVTFTYSPTPSSFNQCSYRVETVPIKTTIEYKDVIKEKTVTKYRDETRYRKVTKTRTETREREVRKTRTDTKQKEVNWIFGFDAIIKFRDLG